MREVVSVVGGEQKPGEKLISEMEGYQYGWYCQ